MNVLGPDMGAIGREYNDAVDVATNDYVSKMTPYADSGAGANIQGQQGFSGQLPTQQTDVLGNVSNYLDPSLGFQIQNATDQLQNAYGQKGSLFSGAAGRGISENARKMAETGYADAFNRAMQDTNRINALGQQQFENEMSVGQFNNAAEQQNFQNQFDVNRANFSNQNDLQGTAYGAKVNAAGTTAQLKAGEKSGLDYLTDITKIGTGAVIGAKTGGIY